MNILAAIAVSMVLAVMPLISYADDKADVGIMQKKPLIIMDQGSFTVGGRVIKEPGTYDESHALSPAGQEKHVDQGYVFYQVPANAKKVSLVFLHGASQSGASFETTPDGREGFQTIFLRKGYPVYLMDQPRRGRAGASGVDGTIKPVADEALWFDIFRFGHYPKYFDNVQIPHTKEAEEQFWQKGTPNTGAFDPKLAAQALSAAVDRAGPSVLVTHSQGGAAGMAGGYGKRKSEGHYCPGTGGGLRISQRRSAGAPPFFQSLRSPGPVSRGNGRISKAHKDSDSHDFRG